MNRRPFSHTPTPKVICPTPSLATSRNVIPPISAPGHAHSLTLPNLAAHWDNTDMGCLALGEKRKGKRKKKKKNEIKAKYEEINKQ